MKVRTWKIRYYSWKATKVLKVMKWLRPSNCARWLHVYICQIAKHCDVNLGANR